MQILHKILLYLVIRTPLLVTDAELEVGGDCQQDLENWHDILVGFKFLQQCRDRHPVPVFEADDESCNLFVDS